MSFAKALQNTHKEEYEAYFGALGKYKTACAVYRKIKKEYGDSQNPQERFFFYEAQREFKQQCKDFYAARARWENIIADERLRVDGQKEFTAATIMRLAGIKVPTTLKEVVAHIQAQSELEYQKRKPITEEERAIALSLLKKREERESTIVHSAKDDFLSPKDDPTAGDFEPLP